MSRLLLNKKLYCRLFKNTLRIQTSVVLEPSTSSSSVHIEPGESIKNQMEQTNKYGNPLLYVYAIKPTSTKPREVLLVWVVSLLNSKKIVGQRTLSFFQKLILLNQQSSRLIAIRTENAI